MAKHYYAAHCKEFTSKARLTEERAWADVEAIVSFDACPHEHTVVKVDSAGRRVA
jgi:hypothetical protein